MTAWKTQNAVNAARWLVLFSPLGIDLYLPAISSMTALFGEHVHLSLTLYILALGLGQLLWGPLSDRWGRKPISLSGIALFSGASLCIPWSNTLLELCILRGIQGLGASAAAVCATALIRDRLSGASAAREYGILGGILNVIPVVAPLVGSGLLMLGDWTLCFLFLTCSGVGLGLHLWKSMEETRPPHPETLQIKTLAPWRSLSFMGFSACCCGALALILSYVTLAPYELMREGGLSPQEFGILFGFNGFCISVSCLWFAKRIEKKGALWGLWTGLLFMGVGGLGLISQFAKTDALSFMIPVLVMGIGFGALLGPASGLAMQPFSKATGQAAALLGASQMLTAAVVSGLIPYAPYPRLSLGLLALTVATGSGLICWHLTSRFGAQHLQGNTDHA